MATTTSHRPFDGRAAKAIAGLLLAGAGLWSTPAAAALNDIDLICPCQVEKTPTSATVTFGVHNFGATASGPLRVQIWGVIYKPDGNWERSAELAVVELEGNVAAGARLPSASYAVTLELVADGPRAIELQLEELQDGFWNLQHWVRTAAAVDLSGPPFTAANVDTLADTDGDGVGDFNEALVGTDAADPNSTPGDSTLDLLALYSPGYANLHGGTPITRIRHVVALADDIFRNSGTGIRLRIVGLAGILAEVEEDDPADMFDRIAEMRDQHGADLVLLFRPVDAGRCGWAVIGGWRSSGYMFPDTSAVHATVIGHCTGAIVAHEIGHVLGLGHSFRQGDQGTFRWSRGHGVWERFVTIMAYSSFYNANPLNFFSDPALNCQGLPCGQHINESDGANAVASLNAVRFQVARYRESKPDTDRDGFVDAVDELPENPEEWLDSDGDGIGNNADADDDNDGVVDAWDIFPLDPLEVADSDGDGTGDNGDAFPNDPTETLDTDGDGLGDNADEFPTDPTETTDSDGDGVGDNGDVYPSDPTESADTDGDGVGDNADEFPTDPTETADSDGDGVGDNSDVYPDDPTESADTDGDGVGDNADVDADNDGVLDAGDVYPFNPAKFDIASYQFLGEQPGEGAGASLAAADFDGDGQADFVIAAPEHTVDDGANVGAVYIVSSADLAAVDAADGTTDRTIHLGRVSAQPGSWKLVGETAGDKAGFSVAVTGDVNGDGVAELLVGAPDYYGPDEKRYAGAAYLVVSADLAAADAADGAEDGVVQLRLIAAQPGSWKLVGETYDVQAGASVAAGNDLDGDGLADLIIGAPGFAIDADSRLGAVYLVSSANLAAADAADDVVDGVIDLGLAASEAGSWRLVGEADRDQVGRGVSSVADLDGDGLAELLIGAPEHDAVDGGDSGGAVYLLSGRQLAMADAADGAADGTISLARIARRENSWKLLGGDAGVNLGRFVSSAGDIDGDNYVELILGGNPAYIVSVAGLAAVDAADDAVDGVIDLRQAPALGSAWGVYDLSAMSAAGDVDGDGLGDLVFGNSQRSGSTRGAGAAYLVSGAGLAAENVEGLIGEWQLPEAEGFWTMHGSQVFDYLGSSFASAGDVDGDGLADLLLGASGPWGWRDIHPGTVYLLLTSELAALDAADDSRDGVLYMANMAGDTDGDGVRNTADRDDDGDGVVDADDALQLDPNEWDDRDGDGTGDRSDAFPDDWYEQLDSDADGIGNNADLDDDGDGVPDEDDEYPLDTDNDGAANDVDADDDGDGVLDAEDDLPLDANESQDTDHDGIGNRADDDDDNDGVADADDAFPLDPNESLDTDGDGVGDNADAFPNDPGEWRDSDADGVGNNADADDDNDGVTDAADAFPLDPEEWADGDGDGVGDNADAFPSDPGEWADTDGDGIGDNADLDDDGDGVADAADPWPLNPAKSGLTSYKFVGERAGDYAGYRSVALAGDVDGDGLDELIVGAPGISPGAAYLLSGADLAAMDVADGSADRVIALGHVAAGAGSWKLVGEEGEATVGVSVAAAGDVDGDGRADLMVGAPVLAGTAWLLSGADLAAADAADRIADSVIDMGQVAALQHSWKFGWYRGDDVGSSVSTAGDVDGDGRSDVLIGTSGLGDRGGPGWVNLVLAKDLFTGASNRLWLPATTGVGGSWQFEGEAPGDGAGYSVAAAGDVDGDGGMDVIIGAPRHVVEQVDEGAAYLVTAASLVAADGADGDANGRIDLSRISGVRGAWKFIAEEARNWVGSSVSSAGDVNGDGMADVLIGAPGHTLDKDSAGAAYLVSGAGLEAADEADGDVDGVIDLGQVAALPGSWKFVGEAAYQSAGVGVAAAGDVDGDGTVDLLIGVANCNTQCLWAYLISGGQLPMADAADGSVDGVINLGRIAGRPGSWAFLGNKVPRREYAPVSAMGDVDGDGFGDLILGAGTYSEASGSTAGYLLSGADLPLLDARDGRSDGIIDLRFLGR